MTASQSIGLCRCCIVWGLETPHTSEAILNIKNRGLLQIAAWFGDKKYGDHVTHHVYDFQGRSTAIKQSAYVSVKNSVYELIYQKYLSEFLEVTSRSYQNDIKSFQDLTDIIAAQVNYLEALLVHQNVDLVIFHNVPHEGPDYLLYQIAVARNIKTIIFNQSLFENRLFILGRIEELGLVSGGVQDSAYHPAVLERKHQKEYFYMKNLTSSQQVLSAAKRALWIAKVFLSFLSVFGFKKSRRYFYRYFYWLDFSLNKERYASKKADLSNEYVYFPLHLQPEMTTSALGGIYCDQLLAIERVRDLIPDEWLILVKENPKQEYTRRGAGFFERLARIPNVVYMTDGNTHELTEKSQFVATITGSAGWEAICGGKSVLVFGDAWYQSFPGVFRYSASMSHQEISQAKFELKDLQQAFNELMRRSHKGVVDPAYIEICSDYNIEKNNLYLEQAILSRLL